MSDKPSNERKESGCGGQCPCKTDFEKACSGESCGTKEKSCGCDHGNKGESPNPQP